MLNPLKSIQPSTDINVATYNGVISKTLLLFLVTLITTLVTYMFTNITLTLPLIIISGILGIILLWQAPNRISYKKIALPFALLEGIGIGAITQYIEHKVPGVGLKAAFATILSFIIIYGLFSFKLIKVTPNLKKITIYGLIFAMFGLMAIILLTYFKVIVLTTLFLNIIFGFTLLLGLCTLLINFDDVFNAVNNRVKQEEEWGLAISLLLSIILIYESFLRLFGINLGKN